MAADQVRANALEGTTDRGDEVADGRAARTRWNEDDCEEPARPGAGLLATETSPSAARVTAAATKLASATGWPFVIMANWSVPVGTTAFESLHDTVAREDDARAAAVDACGLAAEAGVEARTLAVEGDAPAEICAAAEREQAAVIVIGTHSGRLGGRGRGALHASSSSSRRGDCTFGSWPKGDRRRR